MIAQDPAFNRNDKTFLRNQSDDRDRPKVRVPDPPHAWRDIDDRTFLLAPFLPVANGFPSMRNTALPLALMTDLNPFFEPCVFPPRSPTCPSTSLPSLSLVLRNHAREKTLRTADHLQGTP